MNLFSTIVALLESVSSSNSLQTKEAQFRKFFSELKNNHRTQESHPDKAKESNQSIYSVLRLLVPGLDRERKAYGLREKTLAEAYVRALGLARRSKDSDAGRLLSARAGRDLGDRLVALLRGRCSDQSKLTVAEVNSRLDALAVRGGAGVQDELSYLIEHGTALDHRWLVRIVLRNLRLGQLSGRRILQLYHPRAPTLYDSTGDLRYVVQLLEQSGHGAEAVGTDAGCSPELAVAEGSGTIIRLGNFVRPMLCQRVELHQISDLLGRHTFWLETKMDGERFQVHKDGSRFCYLSRNGIDYSATFGTTADQLDGTLTPLLAQLLAESVHSVILDGEMMVFDRHTLRYRDKCDGGADVKALRPGNGELRACFCVYDVLLLNGRPLTEMPYVERARLLGTVLVREQLGFVVRCWRQHVRDREHFVALVNEAIDSQQEGVVLKREDAPYQPNRRAGGGWYKIKPDYIAGLVTDFDLLVLGGYYNSRCTSMNVLVVGVIAEGTDGKMRFLSVVKVSMGLSAAQWMEMNRSLRPHWQERSKGVASAVTTGEESMVCWGRSGPPDVCIEPTCSIVLTLKGSELVRSDTYGAGYTIRFPRIVAIRSDKLPNEVCTLAELEQVASGSGTVMAGSDDVSQSVLGTSLSRKATKLAKRHVTLEDLTPVAASKGKSRKKRLMITTTGPMAAANADLSSVPPNREGILRGRDICIMGGVAGSTPIRELEALVWQHGGRAVANPGTGTFAIVVVGLETFKVRKYCATGRWDMVRADWLLRATAETAQRSQLEPFRPSDMLACTESTRLALAEAYDRYGDSYTRPVSPSSFAALLRQDASGVWSGARLTERELVRSERMLLGTAIQNQRRLFRGLSARFYSLPAPERDENEQPTMVDNLRAHREMLRFVHNGGQWLRDSDPGSVGYVFVAATHDASASSIIRWLQSIERATRETKIAIKQSNQTLPDTPREGERTERQPNVLRIQWIVKSLEQSQLCDVSDFVL